MKCLDCGADLFPVRQGEGFYCPAAVLHGREAQRRKWTAFGVLLTALALLFILSGCSTVTAPRIHDSQPSWDGHEQNSGLTGFAPSGGAEITAHARDRYNALVGEYGRSFSPPIAPGEGLTESGEKITLDEEHLVKFMIMNRWRKEGRAAVH